MGALSEIILVSFTNIWDTMIDSSRLDKWQLHGRHGRHGRRIYTWSSVGPSLADEASPSPSSSPSSSSYSDCYCYCSWHQSLLIGFMIATSIICESYCHHRCHRCSYCLVLSLLTIDYWLNPSRRLLAPDSSSRAGSASWRKQRHAPRAAASRSPFQMSGINSSSFFRMSNL